MTTGSHADCVASTHICDIEVIHWLALQSKFTSFRMTESPLPYLNQCITTFNDLPRPKPIEYIRKPYNNPLDDGASRTVNMACIYKGRNYWCQHAAYGGI